jgi:hypothetical protein
MSYDVFFWREQPDAKLDPERVLRELEDTVVMPGVVAIPLDTVKPAFKQQFPDISDDGSSLEWEGDDSYFQVGFTFLDERTVSMTSICCGYELLKSPTAMQRLRAVASALGCRFFDPHEPAQKPSFFRRLFG